MVHSAARVPRLGDHLCWPMMTHAAGAPRSAYGFGVWVTKAQFPIIYRETSLWQIGGALLLLLLLLVVFRAEHLLFNR